ncbi:hypothetical protein HZB02_02460 [Candidatus Woesearchaeota archaeon]|nr:hypothetical protein [Candidatus Woesearchaeota archaeon]
MDRKEVYALVFREKPALILAHMLDSKNVGKDVYPSFLGKAVDCTYSHVVKVLMQMQKANLVTYKRKGRMKILQLTPQGQEIAHHLSEIKRLVG